MTAEEVGAPTQTAHSVLALYPVTQNIRVTAEEVGATNSDMVLGPRKTSFNMTQNSRVTLTAEKACATNSDVSP